MKILREILKCYYQNQKDFIDLKDRELKDREIKLKREIEELFFKLIFFPIEDMDWFEKRNEENNAN